MNRSAKKVTLISVSIALAMIFSYVESFVPMIFPGVKLGLANTVTLFMLYTLGIPYAFCVSFVRIFLSTLLFGGFPTVLIFSYSGFVLSFCAMLLCKYVFQLSVVVTSVIGGVMHNIGQVIAFCIVMRTAELWVYVIPLFATGVIAGLAVGIVSGIVIKKLKGIII